MLKDTEEVKQQTSATVKASIDGAGMGALLDGPTGAGVRQALPSGGLDQIMAAAQQAQPQGQGPDLSFALFLWDMVGIYIKQLLTSKIPCK